MVIRFRQRSFLVPLLFPPIVLREKRRVFKKLLLPLTDLVSVDIKSNEKVSKGLPPSYSFHSHLGTEGCIGSSLHVIQLAYFLFG
jgi:hypothetical protein